MATKTIDDRIGIALSHLVDLTYAQELDDEQSEVFLKKVKAVSEIEYSKHVIDNNKDHSDIISLISDIVHANSTLSSMVKENEKHINILKWILKWTCILNSVAIITLIILNILK